MKLLFLLVALCCVAASAEVFVTKMYMDTTCGGDFASVSEINFQVGCKDKVKSFVDGNDLKQEQYAQTDCTGTISSTTKLGELNKCVQVPNSLLSYKYARLSDADFNTYLKGPGNIVAKQHPNTDNCADTSTTSSISLATLNGKCMKMTSTTSRTGTWDDKKMTTKDYGTADCSGTVTSTSEAMFNTCQNQTSIQTLQDGSTFVDKRSSFSILNPTSSGLRSTSLRSTMVFAIIFVASTLY